MTVEFPLSIKKTGSFELYLAYVNSLPSLSEEQEKALFAAYHESDDLNAVQQIVLSHLRFVAFVARKYKGYGLPMEDLVQEGTIGLMKSVKKFSLDFGVRLASFAVHYIKAEINEYVIRNWRLVKAATTKAKRKIFFNLRRLRGHTEWLTHAEKTSMAEQLSVSVDDVSDMEVQLSNHDMSLHAPLYEDDQDDAGTMESFIADSQSNFADSIIEDELRETVLESVHKMVASFDDRTRDIVENRWFVDDVKTYKYFAEKYGVSQERIRQIEEKALLKVRQGIAALTPD